MHKASLAEPIVFHEPLDTLEITIEFDRWVEHQSQLSEIDGTHFQNGQNYFTHHLESLAMTSKIPGKLFF